MKKYFFVFILFVLGSAAVVAQQVDLRKDDQRFFKGQPSRPRKPRGGGTTRKAAKRRLSKIGGAIWRLARV